MNAWRHINEVVKGVYSYRTPQNALTFFALNSISARTKIPLNTQPRINTESKLFKVGQLSITVWFRQSGLCRSGEAVELLSEWKHIHVWGPL